MAAHLKSGVGEAASRATAAKVRETVEAILADGVDATMGRFNAGP